MKAIILLSFYSLGLAIPFILSGYLMQRFLMFSKNFKKNINLVSKGGGCDTFDNWNSYINEPTTSLRLLHFKFITFFAKFWLIG